MKPNYEHDCSHCIFIGSVTINGRTGDVHIHKDTDIVDRFDELIVRFSDEPSDYSCSHPATFSPLDSFSAAATAMWAEHYALTGWNHEKGALFNNAGKLVVRLWA